MNLIEEAAKRLRQLEEAGVPLAARAAPVEPPPQPKRAAPEAKKRPAPQPNPAQVRNFDLRRMQAAGFITPTMPESRLLHEFRVLKRPLIQHALGRTATHGPNRNLIMVTSALPHEGKTFVALNLAMSLAMEIDCRVLLVDADVLSPSVPRALGIEPARGLMDVLTQPGTAFGDVVLGTNVERLTLLLAGTQHAGASELLASDAMTTLLADLSTRHPDQIVVFDSPPLLATTESRVLATYMGQVVVVVEAERTTHGVLESALSTVDTCPLVYTLLNKASESKVGSQYGYGAYSYGR